jgi:hypothetical protein
MSFQTNACASLLSSCDAPTIAIQQLLFERYVVIAISQLVIGCQVNFFVIMGAAVDWIISASFLLQQTII